MFCIKIKGINFQISFSFFAAAAVIFSLKDVQTQLIVPALLSCFLHEIGHLTFMFLFSYKPKSITLYGGGIKIVPQSGGILSQNQDIIILLAGCAVNFLSAAIWLAVFGGGFFFQINILLGVFNLMPFKYFDGGRVLEILFDGGRIYDIIRGIFLFMGLIFILLMWEKEMMNLSFLITFSFIAISEIFCGGGSHKYSN